MSQNYTKDHITVVKVLGRDIPKRPSLSTGEICKLGFKDKGDKADRIVRNAYRKLREHEVIEIAERGMYRLTSSGVSIARQIKEKGADSLNPDKKKAEKTKAKKTKVKKTKAKKVVKSKAKKKVRKPREKKVEPVMHVVEAEFEGPVDIFDDEDEDEEEDQVD